MSAIVRIALSIGLLLLTSTIGVALDVTKAKETKLGKYMTAREAYEIVKSEPGKTLFVDVRTRAELMFVGMTHMIDGHVPFVEMNEFGEWDEANARYKLDVVSAFSQSVEKLLAAKGLTKSDRVILMCRSGDRSARAVNALADAGFTNAWSQIDGFEGDLSKEGRRDVNGWKKESLPWTYKLDKSKVYLPPR